MRVLKIFDGFVTNHSTSASQVLVVGLRNGKSLYEILKGFEGKKSLNYVSDVESLECDHEIKLEHLTDDYDILESHSSSFENEHSFFEKGAYLDYMSADESDGDAMYEAFERYIEEWKEDEGRIVDYIKEHGGEDLIVLYFEQSSFESLEVEEKSDLVLDTPICVSKIFLEERIIKENLHRKQNLVLMELEKHLKKSLPLVSKIDHNTFGVQIEGQTVIGLGLYYQGLTTLPESISNLKSLITLDLSYNKFTTLPEVITKLISLQILDLGTNNLSTLPESIGNLKSLQTL